MKVRVIHLLRVGKQVYNKVRIITMVFIDLDLAFIAAQIVFTFGGSLIFEVKGVTMRTL